ncbi:MAG TPA: type II toxin-antitoxin system HicA family toxin [Chloroflexota bacterium]|nr:type II toxin-antitoxin system HicA family toxin [Chloroflexota bacterium]
MLGNARVRQYSWAQGMAPFLTRLLVTTICSRYTSVVTGKEMVRYIESLGGTVVRQRGSHVRVRCGTCSTTVPIHAGQDLPPGTLRAIVRDLEPCLGTGWLEHK